MSYLHCPSCKRAYNIAFDPACPACPVPATLVDPADDIVAATEQLAGAMARATPDEREDAMGRMDRLALPAPGAKPVTFHGATVCSIREALDPRRHHGTRRDGSRCSRWSRFGCSSVSLRTSSAMRRVLANVPG